MNTEKYALQYNFMTHIILQDYVSIFTTLLSGTFGRDDIVGEDGDEGLSSLALIACCSCSYFGPRRYRSNLIVTIVPVFRNFSTDW